MTEREHLLTIAMEEALEVAKRCSKALRFGEHQIQPGQPLNNRQRIEDEYSDFVAAMEMLDYLPPLTETKSAKKLKVKRFLEFSRKICGTLSEADGASLPERTPPLSNHVPWKHVVEVQRHNGADTVLVLECGHTETWPDFGDPPVATKCRQCDPPTFHGKPFPAERTPQEPT